MNKRRPQAQQKTQAQIRIDAARTTVTQNLRLPLFSGAVEKSFANVCLQHCDNFDRAWAAGNWDAAASAAFEAGAVSMYLADFQVKRGGLKRGQAKQVARKRILKEKFMETARKILDEWKLPTPPNKKQLWSETREKSGISTIGYSAFCAGFSGEIAK